MRILGIDPGIAIVGWAVVDFEKGNIHSVDYGSVQTSSELAPEDRLLIIYNSLSEIIEKYSPEEMAVEELFFNTNQKTAIVVAQARGVILLAAKKRGVLISEYTPLQVKQAVCGYGRAEKRQVIAMVTSILGLSEPPKPDDTADAVALAICHAHSRASGIGKYYNKIVVAGKGVRRRISDPRFIEGTNIVPPPKRNKN